MYILLFSCSLIPHFVGFSLWETRNNRDRELESARALCFVVGVFFIAVFFYWIFLFCLQFHWKYQQRCCNISVVFFWWLLTFIWSGLSSSLLTEALDSGRDITFKDYFNATCPTIKDSSGDQCFYFLVPSTLMLLIIFLIFYIFGIFVRPFRRRC